MEAALQQSIRCVGARLDIGLGTRVLMTLDGVSGKHASELIGLYPYEYLIMKMPMVPGIGGRLVPGEMVTLRYMSQGTLTGFRSRILSKVHKPGALIFIEYPDSLERFELREHKRIQCFIPATMHGPRGVYSALIADLSAGGCRVKVEVKSTDGLREIETEEMVVLQANLFTGDGDTTFTCLCRNVEQDAVSITLGLAFTDVSKEVKEKLDEYLQTVISLD